MNRLKSALNPEVAKFIQDNYPVVKKRTALWFFSNELRNNLAQDAADTKFPSDASNNPSSSKDAKKVSRTKILNIWRRMDPESKRRYFNMAEFDEVRYKEQKSQWISEVSSLLLKHGGTIKKISESAPTQERLQKTFLASLDKLHRNYEQMIQTESTKEIYKDAIKKADRYEYDMSTKSLISAVPKSQRSILTRPRRPPCAFILYLRDNMQRLTALKRDLKTNDSIMKLGADEWANLDKNTKLDYEAKYSKLKDEYNKATDEFKAENMKSNDNYLEQASKEKKAFRRSLRKRLRDLSVLPICIRNAFNFFLMEHKDVRLTDLTEVWRNLPEEKKMKYIKMNQDDMIRYHNERDAYNEITKSLNDIISKRKSKLSIINNNNK